MAKVVSTGGSSAKHPTASRCTNDGGQGGAVIIYDGECPFCKNYVRLIRLRKAVGLVELVDARRGGDEVKNARALGYDLNEGMIFRRGGQTYHGADALEMIAVLSSPNGVFNFVNALLFQRRWSARLFYPILRACRNLALRLLGKSKL